MELFNGGHAAHHVLEAGFVSLVVRDVLNGRGATSTLLHSLCQPFDGDFLGVADVDDFPNGALQVHKADETFDSVTHISEPARLLSAALNPYGGFVQPALHQI